LHKLIHTLKGGQDLGRLYDGCWKIYGHGGQQYIVVGGYKKGHFRCEKLSQDHVAHQAEEDGHAGDNDSAGEAKALYVLSLANGVHLLLPSLGHHLFESQFPGVHLEHSYPRDYFIHHTNPVVRSFCSF